VLEDSEDYKAFEAAIVTDYDAQSAVERELVGQHVWRLRHATIMEKHPGKFGPGIGRADKRRNFNCSASAGKGPTRSDARLSWPASHTEIQRDDATRDLLAAALDSASQ
jgi:hypothetical protein